MHPVAPSGSLCLTKLRLCLKQISKIDGCWSVLFFFPYFDCFFVNSCNPISKGANHIPDLIYKSVGFSDLPIQISDIGFNSFSFHCCCSRTHVNDRPSFDSLIFQGFQAHSFCAIIPFKVSVLNSFPAFSP